MCCEPPAAIHTTSKQAKHQLSTTSAWSSASTWTHTKNLRDQYRRPLEINMHADKSKHRKARTWRQRRTLQLQPSAVGCLLTGQHCQSIHLFRGVTGGREGGRGRQPRVQDPTCARPRLRNLIRAWRGACTCQGGRASMPWTSTSCLYAQIDRHIQAYWRTFI